MTEQALSRALLAVRPLLMAGIVTIAPFDDPANLLKKRRLQRWREANRDKVRQQARESMRRFRQKKVLESARQS